VPPAFAQYSLTAPSDSLCCPRSDASMSSMLLYAVALKPDSDYPLNLLFKFSIQVWIICNLRFRHIQKMKLNNLKLISSTFLSMYIDIHNSFN
jgi:hypothetical protein